MDLFDVVRACFRRWYVLVPLLVITAWFAHHSYNSTKPTYYGSAIIGLAPPSFRVDTSAPGGEVRRNGLLDTGGAPLIANMAAWGLHDPVVVQRVVAAGGKPNYVSKMFPVPPTSPPLPMIMIEASEPDPADTTKTLEVVIAQADSTLRDLQQQARVPDDQMVGPFVVSPPSAPIGGMPSRMRSTLALFLAGAVLSMLLAVVVDVLLTRRKSRVRKRRQQQAETTAQLTDAPLRQYVSDQHHDVEQRDGSAPAAERVVGSK